MIERGTTQIRSLNTNNRGKTNLGDLARSAESEKFAAWDIAEQKRAYEEEQSYQDALWMRSVARRAAEAGEAQRQALEQRQARDTWITNKHALMVSMGLKSFDELDQEINDFKTYQANQPTFEEQTKSDLQPNEVVRAGVVTVATPSIDLKNIKSAPVPKSGTYTFFVPDELKPQGLVFPNSISSLNLTTGNVREKIYGSLLDSIQSGYGVDRDVAEVLLEREISGDKSLGSEFSRWGKLINDRAAGNDVMSNYHDSEGNVIPPAPVTPDGGFTALNAITAVAGVGGVLANVGKSILPNIIGSAGTAAKSAGKNAALIAASYPLLGVTSSIGSQHTGDVFKPVEEFESMTRVKSETGNIAFDKILDFGKGAVASVPEAGVAFVNALVGSTVLGSAVFQDIAETTRNLITGNLQNPIETRNTISTLTTGIKGLGESTAIAVYQGIDNPAYMLGNILGFGKTYSAIVPLLLFLSGTLPPQTNLRQWPPMEE